MSTLTSGVLIAIEGIDGAGKSTIARLLYEYFIDKGIPVLLTKEPGGTSLGSKIRELVQSPDIALSNRAEFLCFAADRDQHIQEVIKPNLKKKMLIISDRMADSSLAYQGFGRGLDKDIIRTVNQWVMDGVDPSRTIYVKIPVATAFERMRNREKLSAFEQEKHSFMERVAHGFDQLYENRSDIITVDGTTDVESIVSYITKEMMQWMYAKALIS